MRLLAFFIVVLGIGFAATVGFGFDADLVQITNQAGQEGRTLGALAVMGGLLSGLAVLSSRFMAIKNRQDAYKSVPSKGARLIIDDVKPATGPGDEPAVKLSIRNAGPFPADDVDVSINKLRAVICGSGKVDSIPKGDKIEHIIVLNIDKEKLLEERERGVNVLSSGAYDFFCTLKVSYSNVHSSSMGYSYASFWVVADYVNGDFRVTRIRDVSEITVL